MRRRILLSVAVLAALLISATAALADSQSASSGSVSATFSYTVTKHNQYYETYSHQAIAISRAGTVVYNQPVTSQDCGTECAPGFPTGHAVSLADLDGTGEPDVLLNLFTGGAHCCTVLQVFSYDPSTNTYVKTEQNFNDSGYKLTRPVPGGPYRFLSANDAFDYAFTSYAQSGTPIQIWGFANDEFGDVTRSYPGLVSKDAARWLKLFKANLKDGTGPLSAWAADEELLGKDALVQRTLKAQLKAGHLVGGFINGQKYVTKLNAMLVKLGYKTA